MNWGDYLTFEYGRPVPDKDSKDGAVPVFGTNGQIGTSHLPAQCGIPSFVVGRKGAYRGVHFSPVPFSVIDTAFYALPLTDEVDLKWAYYKFLTYDINRMDSGSAIPSTDRYELYRIPVDIPELGVQKRVVKVLDSIEDKIKKNQEINDNLLQQAIAIFQAFFCNYAFNGGKRPETWGTVTIAELTEFVTRGITPKYDDSTDQIVLNQKCIRNHTIDLTPSRRHLPKTITEKWLVKGDLLINSTGEGTLGRAAQVWFTPTNMTADSHVTIVRPKSLVFNNYIGFWGLTHETQIEALHTGSTGQTELPRERIKLMGIDQPDMDTLTRFNSIVTPITQIIVENQRENHLLTSIRDSLLPKLLSGELDIATFDI